VNREGLGGLETRSSMGELEAEMEEGRPPEGRQRQGRRRQGEYAAGASETEAGWFWVPPLPYKVGTCVLLGFPFLPLGGMS